MPSVFSVPATNASNTISFPRNANRAVFSISSCGQGDEEFWWSNVLQSDNATFTAEGGTTLGFSPFREVQLYIDGMLAGVQWPYAVIFTGGVVPAFWSPIVGIDAFDLKEYEIDISPWLPLLCDGSPHTFTMKVAGLQDNGGSKATLSESVGNSWSLTGKIFIWLDAEGSITTGTFPSITAPQPQIHVSQSLSKNSTGSNETLTYSTSVKRTLTIISTLKTANGTSTWKSQWSQTLSHTDNGTIGAFGNTQLNTISTTGKDNSFGLYPYQNTYSYPFFANSTANPLSNGSTIFLASLSRSKIQSVSGATIYPSGLQPFAMLPQSSSLILTLAGTSLTNTQTGNATLLLTPGDVNKTLSFGSTQQEMRFGGVSSQGALGMEPDTELFYRKVQAVNGSVRTDVQRLVGRGVVDFRQADGEGEAEGQAESVGMEAAVGRMPWGAIGQM
jgi:Peptide N-acetyl-beta-D-glucosaminyl asparaginase amidase A